MRFIKFYHFSTHHLIGVGNNVNWSGASPKIWKGGAQFPVSTENIGEDQKKVFTFFDVQFIPQNQVKTKKKVIASSDDLFSLSRWLEIYISLYFSGGEGARPQRLPCIRPCWSWVIDHSNFIFSYAPKKLTARVVSVTVYAALAYRETSIWAPHGHSALFFNPSLLLL